MNRHAPAPRKAQTLGYLIRTAYEVLQERVYAGIRNAGFTDIRPAHSAVLRHLPEGGARMTELARAAGIKKQSMAYLVDDLVGLGYLDITDDEQDRRAKLVRYTPRGIELLGTLLVESARAESDCAAAIGNDGMQQVRQALAHIVAMHTQ